MRPRVVVRCDALSSDSTSKNGVYSSGAFWDQDGGYVSAVDGSITCVLPLPRGLPECSRGVVARVTLCRCRDALSSLLNVLSCSRLCRIFVSGPLSSASCEKVWGRKRLRRSTCFANARGVLVAWPRWGGGCVRDA